MEEREQRELENYLREFQPRAPRVLQPVSRSQNWRRLAAVIAIFFFGTISVWNALHRTDHKAAVVKIVEETPQAASTIPLTKLALENPTQFEAALDTQASKTLQKFDRTDSALRALGKE
jgi:hypothetical protein